MDVQDIVCSMCGDVGFPEKLFRCNNCSNRFQHSYCSNYYREASAEAIETCDWCKSEEMNKSKHAGPGSSSSSSSTRKQTCSISLSADQKGGNRSEYYSGGKIIKLIKQQQHGNNNKDIIDHVNLPEKGGANIKIPTSGHGGSPSPRTAGTRRYKLLKDVISSNK